MVGDVQEHVLKVDRISRDAEGDDLPRSIAGELLPEGETVHQHRAVRRHSAFAHQIGAGVELADAKRQVEEGLAILLIERAMEGQLP